MGRSCNNAGAARPSALAEQKAASIRQNDRADALPDFRNLGVVARVLLAVNAAAAAAALASAQSSVETGPQFFEIALWVEPVLCAVVVVLYAASPALARLRYAIGVACTMAIVAAITLALSIVQSLLDHAAGGWGLLRGAGFALVLTAMLIEYFRLRSRAFSPALAEARLQALQARIRPHFLFNSLNAVLAIIRGDPKRAEGALEDLADLFRSLLADNRKLVAMRDEISLCRQYLNLEHLRLGERLQVRWSVDARAEGALVPPMLLQPLVENAVYHGIEPGLAPGAIEIGIGLEGDKLLVGLSNPYHPEHQHRQGNRMALANIRERLQLHFDVEAKLEAAIDADRYRINMVMPFRRSA
jgi:two-component system, LytTR family, sensor histidine kinase AlgZ